MPHNILCPRKSNMNAKTMPVRKPISSYFESKTTKVTVPDDIISARNKSRRNQVVNKSNITSYFKAKCAEIKSIDESFTSRSDPLMTPPIKNLDKSGSCPHLVPKKSSMQLFQLNSDGPTFFEKLQQSEHRKRCSNCPPGLKKKWKLADFALRSHTSFIDSMKYPPVLRPLRQRNLLKYDDPKLESSRLAMKRGRNDAFHIYHFCHDNADTRIGGFINLKSCGDVGAAELAVGTGMALNSVEESLKNSKKARLNKAHKSLQWADVYAPRTPSEVCGNKIQALELYNWLKQWKDRKIGPREFYVDRGDEWLPSDEDEEIVCNMSLLIGSHGCGKTSTVYACARDLDFNIIEVNASQARGKAALLKFLGEATQSHAIRTEFNDKKEMKSTRIEKNSGSFKYSIVLIEEIDVVFDIDAGFFMAIKELRASSKIPIVLTASSWDSRFTSLNCFCHNMCTPRLSEVSYRLAEISAAEKLNIPINYLCALAQLCNADLRRSIMRLQGLHCFTEYSDNSLPVVDSVCFDEDQLDPKALIAFDTLLQGRSKSHSEWNKCRGQPVSEDTDEEKLLTDSKDDVRVPIDKNDINSKNNKIHLEQLEALSRYADNFSAADVLLSHKSQLGEGHNFTTSLHHVSFSSRASDDMANFSTSVLHQTSHHIIFSSLDIFSKRMDISCDPQNKEFPNDSDGCSKENIESNLNCKVTSVQDATIFDIDAPHNHLVNEAYKSIGFEFCKSDRLQWLQGAADAVKRPVNARGSVCMDQIFLLDIYPMLLNICKLEKLKQKEGLIKDCRKRSRRLFDPIAHSYLVASGVLDGASGTEAIERALKEDPW